VWIGSHAIILPGVRIGRHAAIGAGSVVTKNIPANCLAVGNPARVVRRFVPVGVDGVAGAPYCESSSLASLSTAPTGNIATAPTARR
jgi:tetrahydrodipicolinate N-succinyltransferase